MSYIPVMPVRPFHTTDTFLRENKEQTFLDEHGVRANFNKLPAETRQLHPFVTPIKRGKLYDIAGRFNYVNRALGEAQTGRAFSSYNRYERLQLQHELSTELRYNGETERARYLRWAIASYGKK